MKGTTGGKAVSRVFSRIYFLGLTGGCRPPCNRIVAWRTGSGESPWWVVVQSRTTHNAFTYKHGAGRDIAQPNALFFLHPLSVNYMTARFLGTGRSVVTGSQGSS